MDCLINGGLSRDSNIGNYWNAPQKNMSLMFGSLSAFSTLAVRRHGHGGVMGKEEDIQ